MTEVVAATNQSRGKNWCFTLNNFKDEDQTRLRSMVSGCEFLIFGREVGESGTPHLQGFVRFKTVLRFNQVAKLVGKAHLSIARNVSKSVEYCRKDKDFEEFGEPPVSKAGKRSDLEEFKEAVKNGEVKSFDDLREMHSEVYAKFPRFCAEYIEQHTEKAKVELHPLRQWQGLLYEDLSRSVDKRKIIFIVDKKGNSGKSWFCDYVFSMKESCQILTPGKKADMAFTFVAGTKILFMDAPRSKQSEFLQYDFLEDVKNGRLFSTKYESRMKRFDPPHVVVMMNEHPDMTKLSDDRYDIRVL